MEVVEARMTDVIRKTYFYQDAQVREFGVRKPLAQKAWLRTANAVFERAHDLADRIASAHPLYERACRLPELVRESDPIMHHTFDAGEGVLIPGEILHHAKKGCRSFVILGPFGCLPNHVCGRGIVRQLKERYPDANILALDYDPDASFANIENRLQMLVMNAHDAEIGGAGAGRAREDGPRDGGSGEAREDGDAQGGGVQGSGGARDGGPQGGSGGACGSKAAGGRRAGRRRGTRGEGGLAACSGRE